MVIVKIYNYNIIIINVYKSENTYLRDLRVFLLLQWQSENNPGINVPTKIMSTCGL